METKLTVHQLDVLKECLKKGSGGLSLPMGFGKTLISLVLTLQQQEKIGTPEPILVVCSKTLIESWIFEIKKFFGSSLSFEVFHGSYIKDIDSFVVDPNTKVILTTPEMLTKAYKTLEIEEKFIKKEVQNEGEFNQHFIKKYLRPTDPYTSQRKGLSNFFSRRWSCLVVDEVQKYTNIENLRCQAIGAICAHHRWVLSGTMFAEPIPERILGYYIIIDDSEFPRDLPSAKKFIGSSLFRGFRDTIVERKENPSFIKPIVNQQIISHSLSKEEEIVYTSMKKIFNIVNAKKQAAKTLKDKVNVKKYSSILLSLFCYLRQCLVSPIAPLKNEESNLSQKLVDEVEKQGLKDWINDEASLKSTRMKEALKVIEKHSDENIVVFSCFRKCIPIFRKFLPSDRKVFTLESKMSSDERFRTLEEFSRGKGNILLLTFDIGAEGLNLQSSNTVVLLDFFWNDGKTQQAIARVLRYGQMASEVNIYLFTSNTAIEKAIFEKHDSKLSVIEELSQGRPTTKVTRMKIDEIVKIINREDNIEAIKKVHKESRLLEKPEDAMIKLKRRLRVETEASHLDVLKIKGTLREMFELEITKDILLKSDVLSLLRYLRHEKFPEEKVRKYAERMIQAWKERLRA